MAFARPKVSQLQRAPLVAYQNVGGFDIAMQDARGVGLRPEPSAHAEQRPPPRGATRVPPSRFASGPRRLLAVDELRHEVLVVLELAGVVP